MNYSWKLSGEAGFGITTIGVTFARLMARLGLHVWSYAEYPSLIRGGFTTYEVTFSDTDPLRTRKPQLDFHICLRQDGYDRDVARLAPHTIVLYDQDTVKVDDSKCIHIPMPYKDIKAKHKAFQVMVNTVSIGATCALFGWDLEHFNRAIEEEFARKGEEVIRHNKVLAQEGWDHIQTLLTNSELKKRIDEAHAATGYTLTGRNALEKRNQIVLTGNDGFSLGSVIADVRAYCAYPMSPASTVLSTLAGWSAQTKMVVRHTEDEIAAINQALGFAYAGVRVGVGTSGGGFALMVEALSYAGVAELPIVVYLAQRPGPATGLPTWTGQGDLLFAVHAGHGEFMKVVLAPGDAEENIELAAQAYNIADVFQTPVIVVSDKLLAESHSSVTTEWVDQLTSRYVLDRGRIVTTTEQNPYLRYKASESGISEFLIPGSMKTAHWQANSYEHEEDSHTTEDAAVAVQQVNKRMKKIETYLASKYYTAPKVFGDIETADTIFVSYGANKHVIRAALSTPECARAAYIHFTHLYPLKKDEIRAILGHKARYVIVENSATAQLGKLIAQECGIDIQANIVRFDGRPIELADIMQFMRS